MAYEMKAGGGSSDTGGGGAGAGAGGGGGADGGGGGGDAHEASSAAVSTPTQAQGVRLLRLETGASGRAAGCGADAVSLMWANWLDLIGPDRAGRAYGGLDDLYCGRAVAFRTVRSILSCSASVYVSIHIL